MEQNNNEKDIISKLFVSNENITERLQSLVELCHGLFNIVQETGEVFLEDASFLNNNEKILLYMTGTYFSWKSHLKKDNGMSISELANRLGVPITTISAPLKKLIEDHLISKKSIGSYEIRFENYKILRDALVEIKKKKDKKEAKIK